MRRSILWTNGSIATLLTISGVGCQLDEPARANDPAYVNQALTGDLAGTYVPGPEVASSQLGVAVNAIGDTLPGTDPAAFAEAREAFAAVEEIDEGLGPIFNEAGCGVCHSLPVLGGSGTQIERRFGRIENGRFFGFDADDSDNQGGTLRQLRTVGTFVNGGRTCTIPLEVEPAAANVRNVGRRTTPLFGLGLMDAMPDAVFAQVQQTQPSSVRGIARSVEVIIPDPRDRSQFLGGTRIGRFGWKGLIPSLLMFSGDAYLNEMGISTQSCFRGTSIEDFALENFPNNVPPPNGCNGGDLAPPQPAGNGVPTFTDDAVGSCAGGRTEIQDDLVLFTTFMEHLAPPPRDLRDGTAVERGPGLFAAAGCSGCHVTGTYITPTTPFNGVPGRFRFQPFSDFMLHDMGSLGDRLGNNTGDSEFRTRLMRTAPLWGARFNPFFLHDGRARSVREAIQFHDGTARPSRDAFNRLSAAEQDLVLRYVNTL
jgi:CxxC motif-containing protein (DUF1111 family)